MVKNENFSLNFAIFHTSHEMKKKKNQLGMTLYSKFKINSSEKKK